MTCIVSLSKGARALQRQFELTPSVAKDIIASCPDCQQHVSVPQLGVNPRGLQSLQVWQTDVTHIPEFGRLKYVHVSVDTFSTAVWATAHSGEKSRDVTSHWRSTFAALGIPHCIKTQRSRICGSQHPCVFTPMGCISELDRSICSSCQSPSAGSYLPQVGRPMGPCYLGTWVCLCLYSSWSAMDTSTKCATVFIALLRSITSTVWVLPQPKTNVWV
ncbi:uncharacterized protein LOC141917813 [Strix aluco]|uniref:uncharacterized protein LOC141917813 n=1 Tax=Strix aluco TaxID=111821 RepID=UPI003DA30882